MTHRTVVVSKDPGVLAAAVGARLLTRLVDAQAVRGRASVVLTGGGIGIASLAAVRASAARAAVDWRKVDVWWGDERFVAADDDERNEKQAREALLDSLDLDPARVHPMPALGGPDGDDVDAAAARYADELALAAGPEADVPAFDVLLLGMGPEGHTASIFPESPAAYDERTAFAVHGCPKPPPTRISMGFSAINAAREVWMVVTGEDKAPMVAMALGGAGRVQVPAGGVEGRAQTLWLLDEAAAARLPRALRRL
jgi:6-phosphogluconolactonase